MSTENIPFLTLEVKAPDGKVLGTLVAPYRTFSTGSKGFGFSGKVAQGIIGEKGLQASLNLVVIGTKPTA